jgi:hypothetical protein
MSGKEIKVYVSERDDIYYNIIIVDENKKQLSFNDINDNVIYDFEKIEDFVIGSGMVVAYYSIKVK